MASDKNKNFRSAYEEKLFAFEKEPNAQKRADLLRDMTLIMCQGSINA